MRNSGNKASLVKAVKDMTKVDCVSSLPSEDMKTAVITDAMHMIRKLSLKEGETFQEVAQRYVWRVFSEHWATKNRFHTFVL